MLREEDHSKVPALLNDTITVTEKGDVSMISGVPEEHLELKV